MTGAALIAFVTLQRLAELLWSRRNTRRLLTAGAREYGAAHYPAMVALHAAWLGWLWFAAATLEPRLPWVAAYAMLQLLRVWILVTLGGRWTTRIIVPPAAPPLRSGPYRFLRHPNYWLVAAEIAVLPLAFGLTSAALLFSLLNAGLMAVRIPAEDRAWAAQRQEAA